MIKPLSAAILCAASVAAGQTITHPADQPSSAPAETAPAAPAHQAWKFELSPYFWVGSMHGTVGIAGRTASLNQSVSDTLGMYKDHLNLGACLHFEAQNDRWGIFADVIYMELQAKRTGPLGNRYIEGSLQQFVGELGGFYTLIEPRPRAEGSAPFRLDALAGVRLIAVDASIDPGNTGSTSKSEDWIDPIIGLRASIEPADWLRLSARADIGGFNLAPGTTSNFAWNVILGARARLCESFSLDLGYRWLSEDYDNDKTGPSRFRYDVTTSGPFIALTFTW